MSADGVVIVGAGQAGFQLAASLRDGGFDGAITLIGNELELPYQRPPLSKEFLKGADTADALTFRPAAYFAKHAIDLRRGRQAVAIDRARRVVVLDDGDALPYGRLALATGARNRVLAVPGVELDGVASLRDVADALRLRSALAQRQERALRVVVVGGGFMGLEVAVSARSLGADVCVIEAAERLMSRSVSAPVSEWFLSSHRTSGITIELGRALSAIVGDAHVRGVRTTEGEEIAADLVVVAVGVTPNIEIAEAAGLAVDRGIVVDHTLRTSDPLIFALGDCALFPSAHGGGMVRFESVQNAVDQARCVAANMLGKDKRYDAVPWFWSDQRARLQIAGLTAQAEETVIRGERDAFSVYCFRAGVLTGVESVNRPADHVKARRMLAQQEPQRVDTMFTNEVFA